MLFSERKEKKIFLNCFTRCIHICSCILWYFSGLIARRMKFYLLEKKAI